MLYLAGSVDVYAKAGEWEGNGHWYTATFTHRDGSVAVFDAVFSPETGELCAVNFGDCDPYDARLWFDAVSQELHVACRKAGYTGASCWDEREGGVSYLCRTLPKEVKQ